MFSLGMVSSGTLVHQEGTPKTADKLWTLMSSCVSLFCRGIFLPKFADYLLPRYLSTEPDDIQQYIVNHLEYTLARSRFNSDFFSAYQATAFRLEFFVTENDEAFDQRLSHQYSRSSH